MKKYQVAIKLKSGSGYCTEIFAYDKADAGFRTIAKANDAGFKTNGVSTEIIFINQR